MDYKDKLDQYKKDIERRGGVQGYVKDVSRTIRTQFEKNIAEVRKIKGDYVIVLREFENLDKSSVIDKNENRRNKDIINKQIRALETLESHYQTEIDNMKRDETYIPMPRF